MRLVSVGLRRRNSEHFPKNFWLSSIPKKAHSSRLVVMQSLHSRIPRALLSQRKIKRPIYTVQLCRMRYAYNKSTTRVVSCKSNLQLACKSCVRHGECRELLKHVLKPYDNRSNRQFDIVEIEYDFSMTRAARTIKIACDSRKQKSYRVNRPKDCSQSSTA